jgi:hypothetical protein
MGAALTAVAQIINTINAINAFFIIVSSFFPGVRDQASDLTSDSCLLTPVS